MAVFADSGQKPFLPEQFPFGIHRLGDPIRVEHQNIIRVEPYFIRLNLFTEQSDIRQCNPHRKSGWIQIKCFFGFAPIQDHGVMTCTGIGDHSFPGIQDYIKHCNEHALLDIVGHKGIDPREHIGRIFIAAGLQTECRANHGHYQRTGNPFTGNVRHTNANAVLIHFHKVEQVTTHFFGRLVIGCNIKADNLRKVIW